MRTFLIVLVTLFITAAVPAQHSGEQSVPGRAFELQSGGPYVSDMYNKSSACQETYSLNEFLAEVRYADGSAVGSSLDVYETMPPQTLFLPSCILPDQDELMEEISALKQQIAELKASGATETVTAVNQTTSENRAAETGWWLFYATLGITFLGIATSWRRQRRLAKERDSLEERNHNLQQEVNALGWENEIYARRYMIVELPEGWQSPHGDSFHAFERPADTKQYPPSEGWIKVHVDSWPSRARDLRKTLNKIPHEAEEAGLIQTRVSAAA